MLIQIVFVVATVVGVTHESCRHGATSETTLDRTTMRYTD